MAAAAEAQLDRDEAYAAVAPRIHPRRLSYGRYRYAVVHSDARIDEVAAALQSNQETFPTRVLALKCGNSRWEQSAATAGGNS